MATLKNTGIIIVPPGGKIPGGGGTPTPDISSVTVASANGFGGSATAGPASVLTITTGVTGILLGNGTGVAPLTIGSGLTLAGTTLSATAGGGGTVTSVTGVNANGFTVSVATGTTTPAITVGTSITGLLKGNGTAVSAAVAGTDYMTPAGVAAAYQPLDGDLTSLAAAAGTNTIYYRSAASTWSPVTIGGLLAFAGGTLNVAADPDTTLGTSGNVPTAGAVKSYVDASVTGLLDFKGSLACAANPNYPAGLKGDSYYVSSAGKVGGAAGKSVDVGDVVVASADNAGGTEAAVGASWFVLEHNLTGALAAGNNLSDLTNPATARTNLGVAIGTNVQAWDADLDSLAGATGTNTIYYRSAANTWSPVTVGSGIAFAGGTISATGTGGTVTTVSVATANGFAGSVATATTTPAITISTTVTGLLKGNGTSVSAAVADVDYTTPAGLSSSLASYQPLDADLTSLAGATGTNTIYYRSAANTWSPVTIGTGIAFAGGTLSATGSGGTVTSVAASGGTTGFAFTGGPVTGSGTLTLTVSNAATVRAALSISDVVLRNVDDDTTLSGGTNISSAGAVKAYVDNLITGLSWKASVVVATTANITLSGTQTIDGVAVVTNDRVLVKNQTAPAENGIWNVKAGAWLRSLDADAGVELVNATVFVSDGTVNHDTQWTCTNNATPTVGTTAITFAQVSGAGTYTAGTGLTLSSNQFAIDSTVVTLTGAQTLTNKSIDAGQLTGSVAAARLPALTGDVTTAAGTVATTIAAGVVTLAKQANVATATVFYRKTAGTGSPEVQTLATLKTDLGLTGTNSGDQTITLTGDVTGTGTGSFATTIGANKVTDAMLRQGAALTVVGRSANSTGNVADIAAAADGQVLRRSGTALGFGTVDPVLGMAAVPTCVIYNSVNQSTTNSVWTSLSCDTETDDTSGFHSTVTNPTRITIPTGMGGMYLINGTLNFFSNTTGLRIARFFKNGLTQVAGLDYRPAIIGDATFLTITAVVRLAAGDYVEFQGLQNSGGALNMTGGVTQNVFSATFLGP